MLSSRINDAVRATRDNDALVDRMAHDYSRALVVLTLGTIGFAARHSADLPRRAQ